MIILKNVSKTYYSKKGTPCKALQNINLTLPDQGLIVLLGKSGSGKSTLLHVLGGLDTFDSGSIWIDNKSFTQFTEKELDSYRNTYVGFIFQDFHLLSEYNVYENIKLAKELQDQKMKQEELDATLKKLNLEDLGYRHIEELSGGQKQRVAIARALIKDPKLLLADEPTGNLDHASSEQIFQILKQISTEKLVIIVTHDQEAADRYADHIIEIHDGQTTEKKLIKIPNTNQELILKNAKLPFLYQLKMVKKDILSKSFKSLMSILLTTFALIFVGISLSILKFDENKLIIKVMLENQVPFYRLEKIEKTNYDTTPLELTENDLQELSNLAQNTVNPSFQILNNGEPLDFHWNEDADSSLYDTYIDRNFQKITEFIEMKDDNILKNIIGSLPQNDHEIVIHKYLAEYIMQIGIYDTLNNLYRPTTLKEIITDHQPLQMGDNTVYISGIIDDDNTLFQKNRELDKWGPFLPDYLQKDYMKKGQTVYVKGFTQIAKSSINKNKYLEELMIQGAFYDRNLYPLQKEITFINKESEQRTTLQKDEVVLSMDVLKTLDNNFDATYKNFFLKNPINETNLTIFLKEYLKNISLDLQLTLSKQDRNEIHDLQNLKVLGISLDNCTYISNEWLEEYNPKATKITSVVVFEKNSNNLKHILKETNKTVGYENKVYRCFSMNFLPDIISQTETNQQMKPYVILICFIFILFALLLNFNLLTNSIQNNKKEIGILRALGTRKKDIIKIFCYEAIILNSIAGLLGTIGFLQISNWLNQSAINKLFYQTSIILIEPFTIFTLLLFTLMISLIISLFNIKQITKISPIDAINKK
jgi:ABC-type lipoprotein export system ATPase subunit